VVAAKIFRFLKLSSETKDSKIFSSDRDRQPAATPSTKAHTSQTKSSGDQLFLQKLA
jgi:hypothetical protein